jgi:hypothetical protein
MWNLKATPSEKHEDGILFLMHMVEKDNSGPLTNFNSIQGGDKRNFSTLLNIQAADDFR